MIRASLSDKAKVVDILSESFNTNKNVNYVVKQDNKRIKRIKSLMEYTFDSYYESGGVFLSEDRKGAIVLSFPQKSISIYKTTILTVKLLFRTIGLLRIFKVLSWKRMINKYLPKSPFIYLEFIGVYPKSQGNGVGSDLLKKTIQKCMEHSLPIYLVTSMPENLPFYELHQFKIIKEIVIGHQIYILKRE